MESLLVVDIEIAAVGGQSGGGEAVSVVTIRIRPGSGVTLLMLQSVIVVGVGQTCVR